MEQVLKNINQALEAFTAPGADFEIINADIDGQTLPVYKGAPPNLKAIYDACLLHDQRTFLVYQDQRLSFQQTYHQAASFAAALARDFGIAKGDRVAIAMRNNPEWIIAFMAVTALGGVAVPMNAWWTSEELDYGLSDCGAKMLVADRQRLDRAKPAVSRLGLPVIAVDAAETADTIFDFAEVLGRYNEQAMPVVDVSPDDDATILYTSGSTGNPKGVVGTHRGIMSALMSWLLLGLAYQQAGLAPANNPPPEASAALLTVPLFHVTGCHSLFLLSVILGRKLVMMYKWDPVQALALIEQEKISYVNGVPTISQELLDAAQTSDRDISSLVELFSGGAARPPEHVKRIKEGFKLNPGSGYGLTETNALGAVNAGETYIQRPDSVGIPSPAITLIRIVDANGNELATGERGEICIQSAANARCYWNKPEATAEAFRDGWFHTGDVGYLDENGMLFIVDRIKDIIIRGGENISCIEVESAIYAHEGVAEVAVFSLPDDRLGEIVAAIVHLKPGFFLDAEQLRAFMAGQVAAYKIPVYLEFSEEPLPRTGTDKIFKRHIKEQVAATLS